MLCTMISLIELTVEAATPGGLNEQAIKLMRASEHYNVQTEVSDEILSVYIYTYILQIFDPLSFFV